MDRFYKLVCTVCSEEFNAEDFYDDEVCPCCEGKLKRMYYNDVSAEEIELLLDVSQADIEYILKHGVE